MSEQGNILKKSKTNKIYWVFNTSNILKELISLLSEINEEMKMAVAVALADLAREPVPEQVRAAFPDRKSFEFGPEYVVPTPFDPRLLRVVATATAKAACKSGVAKKPISDWDSYSKSLQSHWLFKF